jgi:hypothetical protein
MEYEDLLAKAKSSNDQQIKVSFLSVIDFHSPKPVTINCTDKCSVDCNETHYSPLKGCQCGSWYPCKTIELVERSLDWL